MKIDSSDIFFKFKDITNTNREMQISDIRWLSDRYDIHCFWRYHRVGSLSNHLIILFYVLWYLFYGLETLLWFPLVLFFICYCCSIFINRNFFFGFVALIIVTNWCEDKKIWGSFFLEWRKLLVGCTYQKFKFLFPIVNDACYQINLLYWVVSLFLFKVMSKLQKHQPYHPLFHLFYKNFLRKKWIQYNMLYSLHQKLWHKVGLCLFVCNLDRFHKKCLCSDVQTWV